MAIKKDILGIVKKIIRFFLRDKTNIFLARLSEQFVPIIISKTSVGDIRFYGMGRVTDYRARTLLTKEPETIEWIDSFNGSDILWDIGANIGIYSLYAAMRGISVLAFEPFPANYYLLSKNIEINGMSEKIAAYCLALNDKTKLDSLYVRKTEPGSAGSNFGKAPCAGGQPLKVSFKQAMMGVSIDDFIKQFNPKFPNHIKIDVDGIEHDIIEGAKKTLLDKRLKSVLVELNIRDDSCGRETIEVIESSGYILSKKIQLDVKGTSQNLIFLRQE
jgi:FkbM family methyltransferase